MERKQILENALKRLLKEKRSYYKEIETLESKITKINESEEREMKFLKDSVEECQNAITDCDSSIKKFVDELKVILINTGEDVELNEIKELLG